MSDFIQGSGSGSGDTPSRAWTQMRLDAFADSLRAYYPELAAAFERLDAPGRPKIELNVFSGGPEEGELAVGALEAIDEDLRAGLRGVFEDPSGAWVEGQTFMVYTALLRAFTIGLWLGELGLAWVERPEP